MGDSGMLPTDLALMEELRFMPPSKAEAAVGGVMNFDRTHFEMEDPINEESNSEAYLHNADTTTCKSLRMQRHGLVVISGPLEGGRGQREYLRSRLPDIGQNSHFLIVVSFLRGISPSFITTTIFQRFTIMPLPPLSGRTSARACRTCPRSSSCT